jgi:hypothetical protein
VPFIFSGDSSAFGEREQPCVFDEAVLLRNVIRKKMDEVLHRKISELDRSPLLLGEGAALRL